jgi:hypothetical protein
MAECKPWNELRPGVAHLLYQGDPRHNGLGEALERFERGRALRGLPPGFAVIELAHPAHLSWVLERVTRSGPLRDPRWGQPSDAGLLYGPRRAAAWRTLDAQYFGLPPHRSLFVIASAAIDPAIFFEQYGGRPLHPPNLVA